MLIFYVRKLFLRHDVNMPVANSDNSAIVK
jgi:hypothetical protein